jgi:hypothetical protein
VTTRTRLLGDGTLGDVIPDPAIPWIKLGWIQETGGYHEHGTMTHNHQDANTVHKHGAHNSRLGVFSDGALVRNPHYAQ